jgi:hypothetical protein
MAEAPVSVEAAGANMTPCVDCGHANEVEPRPRDVPDGAILIPESPRGPDFSPPQGTASYDATSVPVSPDILDLGAGELGLPQCTAPARQLEASSGGAELTCSQVVTAHRLLKETLATVDRDVLQLARVSPKMEISGFLPDFPRPSLSSLAPSLL